MEQKMNVGKVLKQEKQKKFLLFLPVVIIPFITLLLWSAGIVGSGDAHSTKSGKQMGFNFHLPLALQAKDSNWNKMQYYAQADKDSERLRSLMRSYHNDSGAGMFSTFNTGKENVSGVTVSTDPKEKMIEEKIAALNKKLNEPSPLNPEKEGYGDQPTGQPFQAPFEKMQEYPQKSSLAYSPAMPDDTQSGDPELEKLDGMLSKVLDIQHPERVRQQIQQESKKNKKLVYPVMTKDDRAAISLLQNIQDSDSKKQPGLSNENHFYGLDDEISSVSAVNTIAAEIPEQQVLVNGAMVKLRLLNDLYIRGTLIPKSSFLYGMASLKGERLDINISSIGYQGQILPIALTVYDVDGQQGLFIPGAITRDVAKQSAGQGIETFNLGTYDASLGVQAASAGIQAAKQLIGKKIKLVKVTVRSGYKVWLRDMNDKNN